MSIFVVQIGPMCFNFGDTPRREFKRHKRGWCWFFGPGSLAYWPGMKGVKIGYAGQ